MNRAFKIISGGQTGVDRAALKWALANHVPHGGWCPAGRKAEDGRIPVRFRLTPTRSRTYAVRTRWNVRDSDATVIVSVHRRLAGGSQRTARLARQLDRPLLHLTAALGVTDAARTLRTFLQRHKITRLNIAGPRASEEPDAGEFASAVLRQAFKRRD